MALSSLFDPLYCQEESLELEEEGTGPMPHLLSPAAAVEDWAEVLCSLEAKEGETRSGLLPDSAGDDTYFLSARRGAVEWVARATARHSFSALTALLAVNYLDRCFLPSAAAAGGLQLQKDKPWMGRLVAVACLSLAAKVEETGVPLLLDLQVAPATTPEPEENKYVFEAKTIRRMELLVLSVLGWRMNPVTPLSFIHHLLPQLCSKDKNPLSAATAAGRVRELVSRCEAVLLSVIADWRWVRYPASVWAAAALLHAAEGGGGAAAESQETHHLISFLNAPKEKVDDCYQLIMESMAYGGGIIGHKRRHSSSSSSSSSSSYYDCSSPPSPNGVIGSCFSCESSSSSGDAWTMWPSSVSSSPEIPPSKKPTSLWIRGNCS